MSIDKSIVLESIKFGFKALYEHIFLFTMVLLSSVGIIGFGGLGCFLFFLQFGWIFSVLHIGLIFLLVFLFALVVIMFFMSFWLGLNKIALDLYDYDKSSMKKLFSFFRLAPRALVAGVIYFVAVSVGSIFFVIPGIFLAIRFSLFLYCIVDQAAGPIESLKLSYKITKKCGWQLFIMRVLMYIMMVVPVWAGSLLVVSGVLIPSLLLTLLYGVSLFAAITFSPLVYAYFYRSLVPLEGNLNHN